MQGVQEEHGAHRNMTTTMEHWALQPPGLPAKCRSVPGCLDCMSDWAEILMLLLLAVPKLHLTSLSSIGGFVHLYYKMQNFFGYPP